MRKPLLAASIAVAFLTLGGQGAFSAETSEDEPLETQSSPQPLAGVPVPTMGGMQFWADELFFHRWRIQRNVNDGDCRLLDGNYLRHASGTYPQCLAKLNEIRDQRDLPAMLGRAVVVLHGLGRTRNSMFLLARHLERSGDYTVFNVGYPSTRQSVSQHAAALAKIIANLHGIEEIHFVGHSLGNIVMRHYLAGQPDEPGGGGPDPRIKRFVMLGPPNHGSIAASDLAENPVFAAVTGKTGQQLGREWAWLETDLATPRCQFGIIAGGRGNEQGFNPLLPGDDDAVVTVESARLAGAADFLVVPVLHTLLITNRSVLKYTLNFLDHGYFISPEERQPLGKE